MARILLLFVLVLSFAGEAWSAGLGDTFADFERTWSKGYRQEFPVGGTYTDVYVGRDKKKSVAYSKGGWFDFNGRIGTIHGETRGMFGVPDTQLPTTKQFIAVMKSMMPADSKLLAKYASSKSGWLREVYIFKSASLAKLPGIEKSTGYFQEVKSIGKFMLIVNHDIDNSAYVINYTMGLGNGETEIYGMKKMKASL